jgi:hypothetical protein
MRIATASLIHRGNRQNNDLSKLPEHKKSDTPLTAAPKTGPNPGSPGAARTG